MSIYVTLLALDGEDGTQRPIRYQLNAYPLDESLREGSFDLSYIPAHIGGDDDDGLMKPYLRVGVSRRSNGDFVDVMLDREQVEEVRDTLTFWLNNAERPPREHTGRSEAASKGPGREEVFRGYTGDSERSGMGAYERLNAGQLREYERVAGFEEAMHWLAKYREARRELNVEIKVKIPEIFREPRVCDPRTPPIALALMGDKAWCDHVDEVRRRSYELSVQRGHMRRYP